MRTLDGWTIEEVSDRCVVQIPANHPFDGSDERVEVYTRDSSGQWWRTYVEPGDGEPSVMVEMVDDRP
jgi:hypothetical protein